MKDLASYVSQFKESIFAQMSALARKHNAVNVGQGFPDFDGPDFAIEAYKQALDKKQNQYAPHPGLIDLRNLLAQIYQNYYQLTYCPDNEITISTGATEAIYTAITALLNPGDEVVLFEPFYDSYLASIQMKGAIPKIVTLGGDDFSFNQKELDQAFGPRTKLVIINSPHNPTGKVFNLEELNLIAKKVREHDCFVISDEVYEHLLYDQAKHIPFASIEGMFERTLTISSSGKTFGVTGWKVGWCCAPTKLTNAFRLTRQFITFSVNTPAQLAILDCLKNLESYLPVFKKDYLEKRDMVIKTLQQMGWDFFKPQGTYFIMLNLAAKTKLNDVDFCFQMIEKKQVALIPPSVFYLKSKEGQKWARFCFAKKDTTLVHALKNLN